jgi:ureidoacrylate peracid hydrolase
MLTIDARPAAVEFDPKKCAVIVVDMQNDFGAPGGMFDRAGIDISGIVEAAEATRPVLSAAREAGIPVIYLTMEHDADLSDAGPTDGPHWLKHLPLKVGSGVVAPDGSASRVLVRNTWNTSILEVLAPESGDHVVSKHRFSGFFETNLDALLRSRGVSHLLVTGCTTSVCVESTVRDAMFRDYSCIVLEDCTAEPIGAGLSRTNHDASLLVIQTLLGWVSNSRAVCESLALQAHTA